MAQCSPHFSGVSHPANRRTVTRNRELSPVPCNQHRAGKLQKIPTMDGLLREGVGSLRIGEGKRVARQQLKLLCSKLIGHPPTPITACKRTRAMMAEGLMTDCGSPLATRKRFGMQQMNALQTQASAGTHSDTAYLQPRRPSPPLPRGLDVPAAFASGQRVSDFLFGNSGSSTSRDRIIFVRTFIPCNIENLAISSIAFGFLGDTWRIHQLVNMEFATQFFHTWTESSMYVLSSTISSKF